MYYKQKICVAALSLTCLLSQASGHLEVDSMEGAPYARAPGSLCSQVSCEELTLLVML